MQQSNNNDRERERRARGDMSVSEAGKKGGESTAASHGREFYQEIGHRGGERVRELVDEAKEAEADE